MNSTRDGTSANLHLQIKDVEVGWDVVVLAVQDGDGRKEDALDEGQDQTELWPLGKIEDHKVANEIGVEVGAQVPVADDAHVQKTIAYVAGEQKDLVAGSLARVGQMIADDRIERAVREMRQDEVEEHHDRTGDRDPDVSYPDEVEEIEFDCLLLDNVMPGEKGEDRS